MMQIIHQLTFEHLAFLSSVSWRKWHSIDSKFLFQFRVSFLRRWWWKVAKSAVLVAKSDVLKHVYSRHSETIFWCSCSALQYYAKPFWDDCLVNERRDKSIAFLNTFDKVLKWIITRRISDLTKTHDLLLVNQMNDRKNRNCETVLKLLTKQIHTIWKMSKNKIATLLSMNVIEAYDHVSREKLLHNFKKKTNFDVNHCLNKQFHAKQKNQFDRESETNDHKQR